MIRIRAFKAMSEPDSCMKYAEGHLQVLKEFDITMIAPLNLDWIKDPYTYVIIAEHMETGKIVAGAQLQLADSKRPLPIVSAIKDIDESINDVIKKYGQATTGELYGLWNAKDIAGMGIGNFYLTLAAIAIAPQLKLNTLFALCSPYTLELYAKFGFEVTRFLGNNGTFYYPKKDLTAIGIILDNCEQLTTAQTTERDLITALRTTPAQTITVESNRGKYDIAFELEIKSSSANRRYSDIRA